MTLATVFIDLMSNWRDIYSVQATTTSKAQFPFDLNKEQGTAEKQLMTSDSRC